MAFQAKYPGRCSVCGLRVQAGDLVDYDRQNRTVSHEDCTPDEKKFKPHGRRSAYSNTSPDVAVAPSRSPLSGADKKRYSNITLNWDGASSGPKIIAMAFNTHNAEQMGEVLTQREFFTGSAEQDAIWDAMMNGGSNIIVNAAAGSGKTTTIQQGILRMMRDVSASARACTYHSLGFAICRKNFPGLAKVKPNEWKLMNILGEWPAPHGLSENEWYSFKCATRDLVRIAKTYLLDGTDKERLEYLADYFQIDLGPRPELVYEAVPKVIRQSLDMTSEIDYQDMISFPAMMDLRGETYDFLIADELQDCSPDQRKLFKLACPYGRIMGVGDSWQSLYAWRGAGSDSMEQFKDMLSNSDRGVSEFPLTMTRRCPKSHVVLAQAICGPGVIEAMPEAPRGVIQSVSELAALSMMRSGDLVLCRVNRYLIPTAYSLIRRGIKAVVRGRDIGQGLESLIDRLMKGNPDGSVNLLLEKLNEWQNKECTKLSKLGEKGAGLVQAVEDNVATIFALTDGCNDVPEVKARIKELWKDFDDDGKPIEAVVLGSIHKTKGLQSSRVFLLHPELMPHPMAGPNFQHGEMCAIYVAVTRAKWSADTEGELVFVGPVPEPIRHAMPVQDKSPQSDQYDEHDYAAEISED